MQKPREHPPSPYHRREAQGFYEKGEEDTVNVLKESSLVLDEERLDLYFIDWLEIWFGVLV